MAEAQVATPPVSASDVEPKIVGVQIRPGVHIQGLGPGGSTVSGPAHYFGGHGANPLEAKKTNDAQGKVWLPEPQAAMLVRDKLATWLPPDEKSPQDKAIEDGRRAREEMLRAAGKK